MLGRKSPLLEPNEKRIEMGGYNAPNFTAFIKLITELVSNTDLIQRFPLSDVEKKLFLHPDLLKTMMSQQAGAK